MRASSAHRSALLLVAALLAACQSAPSIGDLARAQVLELPSSRAALRGAAQRPLDAALRAGVTREAVADGRLLRGYCIVADPLERHGWRQLTVTVLLPAPAKIVDGTQIDVAVAAMQGLVHGRFVATGPALDDSNGVRPGYGGGDRLPPLLAANCLAAGLADGVVRIAGLRAIETWEFRFAAAEAARHAAFDDAALAAGAVARVSCQLKVMDGSDWWAPVWLARVPPGLALQPGDVVSLCAGAQEASGDAGPMAEVVSRSTEAAPPRGRVLCR